MAQANKAERTIWKKMFAFIFLISARLQDLYDLKLSRRNHLFNSTYEELHGFW